MKNNPSITIITVCYNAELHIEKTIQSVINQKYDALEYIIVDGGSKDNTSQIISKYKDKIDQYLQEADKGIYDAMNKGVALATNDWILFLNAGDIFINNEVLLDCSPFLGEKREIVYGDILKANKSGELILKPAESPGNKHRMYFCHQSVFVKRYLLRKHPFDIKYKMSADYKFFKQCFLLGYDFFYIPIAISVFDTTGISNTNRKKGIRENISIIKETDGFLYKVKLLPRLYFVILWNGLFKK